MFLPELNRYHKAVRNQDESCVVFTERTSGTPNHVFCVLRRTSGL